MSPPTSPPQSPSSSPPPATPPLDPSLHDCAKLFPLHYDKKGVVGSALKLSPFERSLWSRVSAVTVGAVGLMSKFWLTGMSREMLILCHGIRMPASLA